MESYIHRNTKQKAMSQLLHELIFSQSNDNDNNSSSNNPNHNIESLKKVEEVIIVADNNNNNHNPNIAKPPKRARQVLLDDLNYKKNKSHLLICDAFLFKLL